MSQPFLSQYGPWAVVTGASNGIGRAVAEQLAQRGLKLVLAARTTSALEQLAASLPTESRIVPVDLAQPYGPAQLFDATSDLSCGLLVNSAGFGTGGEFLKSPLATELEMIDLNCRALAELSHCFGQRFATQRRGGLIQLGSLVSYQGVAYSANYAATKAYVLSLGEALAEELAPLNVHVLSVTPGPVATGFAARASMTFNQSDSATKVARDILHALGRRKTVVPGSHAKLLAFGLDTAPRFIRVQIMKNVMRSMT